MTTVRDSTYALLRTLGMTTIFGNPGSTELPFLADFPSDFTYVLGLHEGVVVGMADGYAQGTGRAALVNVHSSAGLGNAMGGIVNAYHNRAPVVVTAGQQDRRQIASEPLLYGDLVGLARPYVKWAYEPSRAADVPGAIARAYHTAMQAPPGPVFVSIPMDDWDAPADPLPPERAVAYRVAPDPADLERMAQRLAASRRPAILAGSAIDRSGAWEAVVALAERLGAAVWADRFASRAGFPQDHPLFRGIIAPAQGPLAAQLAGNDAVLVLGTAAFTYYPYLPGPPLPPGTALLHVTDDPAETTRSEAGLSVTGDVALAVAGLLDRLPAHGNPAKPAARPRPPVAEARTPIPPAYFWQTLAELLPPETIMVDESASTRGAFHAYYPIRQPGGYFSTGSGGLGFAMPAAVGLKMASPSRPVVCVVGDGSAMYVIQTLWTAVQQRIPVLFVILTNRQYGILKSFRDLMELGGDLPGLDLPDLDVVPIAQGFGCTAARITRPEELAPAVERALASGEPSLLDVHTDPSGSAMIGTPR